MRIAIVGTGISGMTSGYLLSEDHEVTVYEAKSTIGGHTATVDVPLNGRNWLVDTGFIVFNHKTYPHFTRLMDHLDIERAHLIGYSMGAKVANTFRASYPDRLISLTLGGYGWPWRSRDESVAEAEVRLQSDFVLPGNDLRALAAVRVSMNDLIPSEKNLRENTIPAFSLVGTTDNVVSRSDLDTLRSTMANLETKDMPGTHAGPDGAPYKLQFAAELIRFLAKHPAP